MKRRTIFFIILIFIIGIVGCKPTIGNGDGEVEALNETNPTISDYYPFLANTIFKYDGIGNEFAEQEAYFEFIEGNRAQLKIMNPGTHVVKVLELKDDSLREVYYEGEFYHMENLLSIGENTDNILLKTPLEVGNQWQTPEGYTRSITQIDKEIKTPFKTLKALEVTTDLGEGRVQKQYYAKGIGFVANIYEDNGEIIETLLRSVKEEQSLKLDIDVFYPLYSDIETVFIKDRLNFYTNQNIEKLLEDVMKNPPSDKLASVMPESSVINSIKLDKNSWTLRVDFSEEFIIDSNMGSALETEILKSIVNTMGKFYDVENVFISIDGKPYESGHYSLKEKESFKVDTEGIEEIKR
ncbi:MAG: GerMN domain-containing protein [Tissierellaceae bacterium]